MADKPQVRRRFTFDLVGDADAIASIKDYEVTLAIKSEMAVTLTAEQKRKIKVDTAIRHSPHNHQCATHGYCLLCDEVSRDGKN